MQNRLLRVLSLFIFGLWAGFAHAQSASDNPFIALDCELTPPLALSYLPIEPAQKSNNLRRKEGAGIVADGIYTEIKGVVLDRFCAPVSNAIVHLWQTDKAGHYKQYYTPQSEWDIIDENFDENFGYSGTARTNNLGEFYFLTIFPGSYDNRAPHLNVKVSHHEFDAFETQIFFSHHPRNQNDPIFKGLSTAQQSLLSAEGEPLDSAYRLNGRSYKVTITLDGENRFVRY